MYFSNSGHWYPYSGACYCYLLVYLFSNWLDHFSAIYPPPPTKVKNLVLLLWEA